MATVQARGPAKPDTSPGLSTATPGRLGLHQPGPPPGLVGRISIAIALAAPLGGCIVPDGPFQAASAPAAPVPYTVDPLTGARLSLAAPPADPGPPVDPAVADAEVAAFAAQHPLFDLVRDDMALLMRQGRASDLQHAYDQAVAARAARYRAGSGERGGSGQGGGPRASRHLGSWCLPYVWRG